MTECASVVVAISRKDEYNSSDLRKQAMFGRENGGEDEKPKQRGNVAVCSCGYAILYQKA